MFSRNLRPITRLILVGIVLAIGFSRVAAKPLGLDAWNLPALKAELQYQEDVSEKLESNRSQVMLRAAQSRSVVVDVAYDHKSLVAGVEELLQINTNTYGYTQTMMSLYPGSDLPAKVAYSILVRVDRSIEIPEQQKTIIMARLIDQYETTYGPVTPDSITKFRFMVKK